MVMTDAMIEAQSNDREYRQRINKLMICRANYSSGVPNGVEFAECQDESLKPCDTCPVRQEWNKVLEGYMEQGLEKSEASWLTHQFFDIPTAYMCNGKMREAEKKYFPKRYAETVKREQRLLAGDVWETEEKVRKPEGKQMSIFDYLQE